MSTSRLNFEGALSRNLAARLERPAGAAIAHALFAHCFTCSKDLRAVREISRALAAAGIAVLRFDFTGLGESEGDFADSNFSSNIEDLVAAADFLREEHEAPRLLIGHSLGGAAALAAAGRIPEIAAVATIGAPSDTGHLGDTLISLAPDLAARDEAEVELAGRTFRIKRQLIDDLSAHDVEARLAALGTPLLVMHAPRDDIVPIDHARRIYEAARHPKSFVSLDGADHLLTNPRDARFAGAILAAWATRYVRPEGVRETDAPVAGSGVPAGSVEVRAGETGYAVDIETERHRLRADEPADVGGTDSGPNPYELLLAAVGACKAITVRMYADRKGWPLTGSRLRLRHGRVHAEDCEMCESEHGKVDRIDVGLSFEGPLSDEQRARLHEIADRCPVHRTLTTETIIVSVGLDAADGGDS